MSELLKRAFDEIVALPAAEQERIAHDIHTHLAKLRDLRAELDRGIASLDAGKAKELDVEEVIARARARYGQR